MLEKKKSSGMKCRKERKKKKRMRVMSTFNCFFSHASLSNSPWLVCDSQVYSLRKLLVSDAALCICSGEDRTAAAVNYSARMPQSLLGSQPVCHQHFSPQSAFLTCIFFFFWAPTAPKSIEINTWKIPSSLQEGTKFMF